MVDHLLALLVGQIFEDSLADFVFEPCLTRRRDFVFLPHAFGQLLLIGIHGHHIASILAIADAAEQLAVLLQIAIVFLVEPFDELLQTPNFIFILDVEQFAQFIVA